MKTLMNKAQSYQRVNRERIEQLSNSMGERTEELAKSMGQRVERLESKAER
jgi:hypothetical protein